MAETRGIFQRPPKSGIYWISYFGTEGKRHREKIGRRAAAITELAARKLAIKTGKFIPPRAKARLRFKDLASAAISQKKLRLRPSTIETDQIRLKRVLSLIGDVPVDLLTPDRCEDALAQIKLEVSGSTANRYRSLISSIFGHAVRAGKIDVNPISKVKRFKENESRIRWLQDDEEDRLRDAIEKEKFPHYELELDLALHTGMRRGEQFFLEWANVHLGIRQADVNGKTGPRHVTLNSRAIRALRRLQAISGKKKFVCPDTRDGLKRDTRTWFEKAVKKARIENFHWHDLRHTFASRLVMRGEGIRQVQELMGHKSIQMTMKYAHLSQDHRHEAVERLVEDNLKGTRR